MVSSINRGYSVYVIILDEIILGCVNSMSDFHVQAGTTSWF